MMIDGGKWQFLDNNANRQELIKFVAPYVSQERKYHFKIPLIMTFAYTNNEVEEIFISNQQEVDTRLILHALLAKNDFVIAAKDQATWLLTLKRGNSMNIKLSCELSRNIWHSSQQHCTVQLDVTEPWIFT